MSVSVCVCLCKSWNFANVNTVLYLPAFCATEHHESGPSPTLVFWLVWFLNTLPTASGITRGHSAAGIPPHGCVPWGCSLQKLSVKANAFLQIHNTTATGEAGEVQCFASNCYWMQNYRSLVPKKFSHLFIASYFIEEARPKRQMLPTLPVATSSWLRR